MTSSERCESLAGAWDVALFKDVSMADVNPASANFAATARIPGSLDDSSLGELNENFDERTHLSTERLFEGSALFKKLVDIPEAWLGRRVVLEIERTRMTRVWLDGVDAGSSVRCCVSRRHDLTGVLRKAGAGRHSLCVAVDNRRDAWAPGSSHMCAAHTQGNWSGMLGEVRLVSTPLVWLESLKAKPLFEKGVLLLTLSFGSLRETKLENVEAEARVRAASGSGPAAFVSRTCVVEPGFSSVSFELPLDGLPRWDEFSPELCEIEASVSVDGDSHSVKKLFGLTDFKRDGKRLVANGRTVFLRGKHDACVFPLSGYAPMDEGAWLSYMRTLKDYGFNHMRCHTWCPPEAAFAAADKLGVYIQAELPSWWALAAAENKLKVEDPNAAAFGEDGARAKLFDPSIRTDAELYLLDEAKAILDEFGLHPSFRILSLGNELHGSVPVMKRMVDELRAWDSASRLLVQGSNNHFADPKPGESDDLWICVRTSKKTWDDFSNVVRSSFCFVDQRNGGPANDDRPNSVRDFSKALEKTSLPVVSHETGQHQFYPDFKSLAKYSGVMKPWNLLVAKRLLEEKGMGSQADEFFKASGSFACELYRADVEAFFRTEGLAGFQMLDLQDFPGQGTALVGLLDAFMDSKGFTTPELWRRSCSARVLLGLLPRFCFAAGEKLEFEVELANYGEAGLSETEVFWKLEGVAEGVLDGPAAPQGALTKLAKASVSIPALSCARASRLLLEERKSGLKQEYSLWLYPDGAGAEPRNGLRIERELSQATLASLLSGGRVLLHPRRELIEEWSLDPLFTTEYWSYLMFRKIAEGAGVRPSPGTMGLLVDSTHPALAGFPSSFSSGWQWHGVVRHGRPLALNDAPAGFKPAVQVVDSFWRSDKLALLAEFKVGEGKLLLSGVDLDLVTDCVEGRAFRSSLVDYASGDKFKPAVELPLDSPLLKRLSSKNEKL